MLLPSIGSDTQVNVTHDTKTMPMKSNQMAIQRLIPIKIKRADVLTSCASSNTRWQSSWDWWARIVIKPVSDEDKWLNTGLRADDFKRKYQMVILLNYSSINITAYLNDASLLASNRLTWREVLKKQIRKK